MSWLVSEITRSRKSWSRRLYFNLMFCVARMESSDGTHEPTSWQPASWNSLDESQKATAGQSHYQWQWGHLLEPQNKCTHGRRKQRVFVTEYIFSPFLPLVMLPWVMCVTLPNFFLCNRHDLVSAFLFIHDRPFGSRSNSSVHTMCFFVVSVDPVDRESSQFCGFLSSVYCILVTLQKEQIYNQNCPHLRGVRKRTSASFRRIVSTIKSIARNSY